MSYLTEELTEGLDSIDVVGHTACFPAAVHSQNGIAHIDTSEGD